MHRDIPLVTSLNCYVPRPGYILRRPYYYGTVVLVVASSWGLEWQGAGRLGGCLVLVAT
jgi:hypothetical protein